MKYIHLLDANKTFNMGEGHIGGKGDIVPFKQASAEVYGWKTANVEWDNSFQQYVVYDRNERKKGSILALISF